MSPLLTRKIADERNIPTQLWNKDYHEISCSEKNLSVPEAQPFTALTNDVVNDVDPWVDLRGSAGVGRIKHQFTSSVMYYLNCNL